MSERARSRGKKTEQCTHCAVDNVQVPQKLKFWIKFLHVRISIWMMRLTLFTWKQGQYSIYWGKGTFIRLQFWWCLTSPVKQLQFKFVFHTSTFLGIPVQILKLFHTWKGGSQLKKTTPYDPRPFHLTKKAFQSTIGKHPFAGWPVSTVVCSVSLICIRPFCCSFKIVVRISSK